MKCSVCKKKFLDHPAYKEMKVYCQRCLNKVSPKKETYLSSYYRKWIASSLKIRNSQLNKPGGI
jgi:DNA-directed RNA polymerase subunit RPC12/RpoP